MRTLLVSGKNPNSMENGLLVTAESLTMLGQETMVKHYDDSGLATLLASFDQVAAFSFGADAVVDFIREKNIHIKKLLLYDPVPRGLEWFFFWTKFKIPLSVDLCLCISGHNFLPPSRVIEDGPGRKNIYIPHPHGNYPYESDVRKAALEFLK